MHCVYVWSALCVRMWLCVTMTVSVFIVLDLFTITGHIPMTTV